MNLPALALLVLVCAFSGGCAYLQHLAAQNDYRQLHGQTPRLWLTKHLLETKTYFVYGRLIDGAEDAPRYSLTVAALSSRLQPDEIVEVNRLARPGSYYGMNLPEGEYRLVVFADVNRDGLLDSSEVVGEAQVDLSDAGVPERVAGGIDITLHAPRSAAIATLHPTIPALPDKPRPESLFYPKGSLRSFDDTLFSESMAQLGVYDPAAFVEASPTMFYAIEEERGHKVPVVFVHGIGGSPRAFKSIVERMDRSRYKPWFFYYPSGHDLDQLAQLFYDIFLSGKVVPAGEAPLVVVAHSMGGLVVRQAMNLYGRSTGENKVALIVTIASPFGGDPAARTGVAHSPMVVPAWRDLDPGSAFISGLFQKPLPESIPHHVLYAYDDRVVPLSSQLPAGVHFPPGSTHGFKTGHVDILSDGAALAKTLELLQQVRIPLPEDHMRYLLLGGFDVPLDPAYSELQKYMIRTYGRYWSAIASGKLEPAHPVQARFAAVARGEAVAESELEAAWLRFRVDYPGLGLRAED